MIEQHHRHRRNARSADWLLVSGRLVIAYDHPDHLRFEGYDPETVVGEETAAGLREIDPSTGRIVGLEYWHASAALPQDLLTLLPPPGVAAAA